MLFKAQSYFEEDESRYRRPIVENDYLFADDLFDTCTYEKASWMIHQLRGILGDETFFRGTREYLRRFALENAETDDYRKVMEEAGGVSLERYFEQSFLRAGHPEFEVEYAWDEGSKMAGVTVKRVQIRGPSESYHFQLDSEPTIVEFDPEGWLLKKLKFKKSYALLKNQLSSSVDMLSRKSAAEELASFKSAETVELLKAAASKDQYWSVRAEAIRSMGKIGGREALDALLELAHVKQRRVRRAVIAAFAEFKGDERVQEPLKAALFGDESPFNQCESALSIAKAGVKETVQLLSEAMKLESPEYALTEASLEALGYTKSKEAREIIRAHLPYGLPVRVRIGSLKGYDKLGSLESEDFEILKEIALHDKDFVVRDQLLELVADLGDRRFTDTLRKVAEQDSDNRNRRRALEILEDFATGDSGSAIAGLKDEVEKLKGEGRELRDTLSRIERV
jgi:aminopeptidase N